MAQAAISHLSLAEVKLLPCHQPPHRGQPQLSSRQRLHLLELAVADLEGLSVDDRELKRDGPSYTVDTLREMRSEFGAGVSFVLLIGMDAYLTLPNWHQWRDLLALTHIAVFRRPGFSLPVSGPLVDLLAQSSSQVLYRQSAGGVVLLDQQQVDISATEIRQQLAQGRLSTYLPPAVQEHIVANYLYRFKESVILESK